MNLTIDEMRGIVGGAPSNAVIYWPIGSGKFGVYSAGEQNKSDRQIVLEDLRTEIAEHDQQQLQIELKKTCGEDNCTHIRNHVSPNTVVIER